MTTGGTDNNNNTHWEEARRCGVWQPLSNGMEETDVL